MTDIKIEGPHLDIHFSGFIPALTQYFATDHSPRMLVSIKHDMDRLHDYLARYSVPLSQEGGIDTAWTWDGETRTVTGAMGLTLQVEHLLDPTPDDFLHALLTTAGAKFIILSLQHMSDVLGEENTEDSDRRAADEIERQLFGHEGGLSPVQTMLSAGLTIEDIAFQTQQDVEIIRQWWNHRPADGPLAMVEQHQRLIRAELLDWYAASMQSAFADRPNDERVMVWLTQEALETLSDAQDHSPPGMMPDAFLRKSATRYAEALGGLPCVEPDLNGFETWAKNKPDSARTLANLLRHTSEYQKLLHGPTMGIA